MARRWLLPVLLVLAWGLPAVRAEDEGPVPRPLGVDRILLATIETDPAGEATRIAHEAARALADEDHDVAVRHLLLLATTYPDVLLPVRLFGEVQYGRTNGALRWPVYQAVNRAVARLPEEPRARVIRVWAPHVAALEARVRRGDDAAWRTLATHYGATPAGGRALLARADRALEGGRLIEAMRQLEAWLDLHPFSAAPARAAVVLRLADALLAVEDAGALQALGLIHHELREVPVLVAGKTTTLAARLALQRSLRARARAEARAAQFVVPQVPGPMAALRDPVVLWTRRLRDPDYLREGLAEGPAMIQAGAWGRGEALVLHEGRVVRRVDAATGLERWRFPRTKRATLHDVTERYLSYDLPWRSVTPAGDAVLVALGEPSASGRYKFLDAEYEADGLGQECRIRLACLDLATGALRWHTGAVDETDPVLGHRTTGICSPPLVVGNDVYAIFAKRDGATSFHLAKLDVATGRPRWVATLAGGDSGRDDDEAQGGRFTQAFIQSAPWGARPALADGEVCVVPHAGFVAGVAAADGRVRWIRALPRYALDQGLPASHGQSVENTPLAWGDAWLVAAMDSPRLLCLARGSGDLRWQRGGRTPADVPAWRDLLGVVRDADGAPWIRLAGDRLVRLRPTDGSLSLEERHSWEAWDLGPSDPGGRTVDRGAFALRAANGDVQIRPWRPQNDTVPDITSVTPDGEGLPFAGDLVPVGDVWILIGPGRIAAIAQPADVDALLATDEDDAPAVRATRLALLGRLRGDARRVAVAVEAARGVTDRLLRAATFERLGDEMVLAIGALYGTPEELSGLRTLAVVARTLPAARRGRVLHALARRLFELKADGDAAGLLIAWIRSADDTLVPRAAHWDPERDDHVRGDLLAARLLRKYAERPGVADVLAAHERASAARISAARDAGEAALRRAIRQGVGTRAAAQGRRLLLRQLRDADRPLAAAAIAADLRLDPPWGEVAHSREERVRRAARLQMEEAGLLALAGDPTRARTLAADLERWAPAAATDREGRDAVSLRRALRRQFGWHPYEPERPARSFAFDVWPAGQGPKDRDETRSVEFLSLIGPGADALAEKAVVLVRGLTVELWSLATRKRLARLPGSDEGWFGGSLRSIDRWVPGGGILVTSIVAREPADSSGVQDGDWVHTWDGKPVTDLSTFMQLVAASEPGQTIPVGIWRQGRRLLTRFTAGRRPSGQGRLMRHAPLWVDARERVLVPGRTGLAWVDVAKGTRTPLWTWSEPGVVRRCVVIGGEAYAVINRGILPDLVVAVDLARGTERWRAEVRGAVTWIEAVGSALWIQTLSPGQALMVERHDGRPRARFRSFDRHRHEFRKNWQADREAALAAGRGYLSTGLDEQVRFRILNTTTAVAEFEDSWSYARPNRRWGDYVNPQVAAGACVGVVRAGGIRFYFPDPLGSEAPRWMQANRSDLMGTEVHHGPVDSNARLYIRGHAIYLVRMPQQGRKNVNVHVFAIDYDALGRSEATPEGPAGSALINRTHRAWLTGPSSPVRYVLNVAAGFDGILVSTAQLRGDHRAETWWIACAAPDSRESNRDVRLLSLEVGDARRHAPVRIGARLFLPIDRGAQVFPVERYTTKTK